VRGIIGCFNDRIQLIGHRFEMMFFIGWPGNGGNFLTDAGDVFEKARKFVVEGIYMVR
jgi:hypothetical protein